MSAEEMRVELESFVNQGLEKGWCGWPTKGSSSESPESGSACYAVPMAGMLLGCVGQYPFAVGRVLPWSTQTLELQGFSRDVVVRSSNTALALEFGENGPFLCN